MWLHLLCWSLSHNIHLPSLAHPPLHFFASSPPPGPFLQGPSINLSCSWTLILTFHCLLHSPEVEAHGVRTRFICHFRWHSSEDQAIDGRLTYYDNDSQLIWKSQITPRQSLIFTLTVKKPLKVLGHVFMRFKSWSRRCSARTTRLHSSLFRIRLSLTQSGFHRGGFSNCLVCRKARWYGKRTRLKTLIGERRKWANRICECLEGKNNTR